MSIANREIDPQEFEYLTSQFPHVSPKVIRDLLELYNYDDTLFTLQTFYPPKNEAISQNELDQMIATLLENYDIDIDYCKNLLQDTQYDLQKAKEILDQHKKYKEEENLQMIQNDYLIAKSCMDDQISPPAMQPQDNHPNSKKIAVFKDDQVMFVNGKNKKRCKKGKKSSQLIKIDRKRNENENTKIISQKQDSYKNNDNINSYESKFSDSSSNENESINKGQQQSINNENNSQQKVFDYDTDDDNEIKSTEKILPQKICNYEYDYYYDDDEIKSTEDFPQQRLDNDDIEIKSTENFPHQRLDDDDDDEYKEAKRRLKNSNYSANKTTKNPRRYYKPPELVVKEIDLHGVREVDAEEIVRRSLNDAQDSNVATIRFITGAGHHSQNSRSVLRPLVFKICRKMGYKPCLSADKGCVICKIK